MKRLTALLLSALLVMSAFASCAESGKTENGKTETTASTVTTAPAETAPLIRISPDLPQEDYDGYEFTFLTRWLNHLDWNPDWLPTDIDAESENADPINDAVYKRNSMVEEQYHITIVEDRREHISNEFQKAFNNEMASGDNAFDVVLPSIGEAAANYAVSGHLYDLYTIPNLNLENPWWDQNIFDASIGGKLFILEGDMLVNYKHATAAMVFNKQIYEDYQYDNLYDIVKSGKWTFDKLYEYMTNVSDDVDGNTIMDENDRYGLVCQVDSMPSFLHAAGERYAIKDENDMPVMTINSESAVTKMEKIFDIMYSPDARNSHKIESTGNIYAIAAKAFEENRTLFMWIRMQVVMTLRDMEVDFGIVPVPKYDENQEKHYSTVNVNTGYALAIPITAKEPARTGVILEAMSSASTNNLTTAYYDTTLNGKIIRDDESSEMLDIIFANTVYDVGSIFSFGGIDSQFMSLSRTDNRNFASMYSKLEKSINKQIEKLAEKLEKLEG